MPISSSCCCAVAVSTCPTGALTACMEGTCMASLKDEAPIGAIINSAGPQHCRSKHSLGNGQKAYVRTWHRLPMLWQGAAFTLRCQVIAAVDTTVDDIEAGHGKQHFCVACKVSQVLVQRNLLCCSSGLPAKHQSIAHRAASSRECLQAKLHAPVLVLTGTTLSVA